MNPQECTQVLDGMMAYLVDPDRNEYPKFAPMQFLPTGPVQETAMANGWDEAYLALAESFDRLNTELFAFPLHKG